MKICRLCKEEKGISFFYVRDNDKDSLHNVCKKCVNNYFESITYRRFNKKNGEVFYIKKCKTHGVLHPKDILIMQRIDKGKFQITLRCIPCRESWEENAIFNMSLKQKRLDSNAYIFCKRCSTSYLPSNFINSELKKRTPECKSCWKKVALAYEYKVSISRKFKLTRSEYQVIWDRQKGLCAICNEPETMIDRGKVRNLAADHCHNIQKETGKTIIRGLLCTQCNNGLGRFKDSSDLLRKAADYLDNFYDKS